MVNSLSHGVKKSADTRYGFNIFDSMSRIGDLVNRIISPNSDRIDPFENVVLQSDLQRLLIRSYGMDKIFGHIDTNKETQEKFSNLISIVVYNSQNQVEYVNDAYLKATGLSSKDEIIQLSREGKLYETIYGGEELERVREKVSTLDDPRSWGYLNEPFTMSKTDRVLRWNTIKNRQRDPKTKDIKDEGNVRVAIDITDINGFEELLNFERGEMNKSYGFVNTFLRFKSGFMSILNSNPELKRGVTKEQGEAFMRDLALLQKISHIGDIIVDHGPLLVYLQHDREVFLNTRLIDVTGYEHKDLNEMLNKESFGPKLFGMKEFDSFTGEIDGSEQGENIIREMTITRKDGSKMDLLWNAVRFGQDGSQFWTGTIMSPLQKLESEKDEGGESSDSGSFRGFEFDDL